MHLSYSKNFFVILSRMCCFQHSRELKIQNFPHHGGISGEPLYYIFQFFKKQSVKCLIYTDYKKQTSFFKLNILILNLFFNVTIWVKSYQFIHYFLVYILHFLMFCLKPRTIQYIIIILLRWGHCTLSFFHVFSGEK